MERKLQKLFDFQKFQPNAKLQKMINNAEGAYRDELSLDELEWVAAAGTTDGAKNEENPFNKDK